MSSQHNDCVNVKSLRLKHLVTKLQEESVPDSLRSKRRSNQFSWLRIWVERVRVRTLVISPIQIRVE